MFPPELMKGVLMDQPKVKKPTEHQTNEVPAPQPAHTPTKTNALAIWGFILAIFLPLIGLILSIVAMSQIKKRNEGGKGLAIAGIVIGSILLFFQFLIFVSLVNGAKNVSTSTDTNNSSQQSNSSSSSKPAEVAKIGQAVRDGKFEFTVTSIQCGKPSVGDQYLSKTAQGQFCLLNLTVKNIGNESQTFSDSGQLLFDAKGNKYSSDSGASFYANPSGSTFLNTINPGNSVTGAVVFDVPKDVTPTQAELHDSAFSGGVKVNLQ